MWEMAKNSMILFARGKLFKNLGSVMSKAMLGILITATIFVVLANFLATGIYLAAAISAFIGGAIQPYLFKDLKYA